MSPYKVTFSSRGSGCALLDVFFERDNVTSQEVEQVLRVEIEKHKRRTKKAIRAEAFIEGHDLEENPFGLPLPDGSTSITFYRDLDKALTGSEASGGHDELTSDTPDYFYRTVTVQDIGIDDCHEWLLVRVVFKRIQFSDPDEFLGILYKIVVELSDVGRDLTLDLFTGDPEDPMSWRHICDLDGKRFDFSYDAEKRIVRSGKKIVARLPGATTKAKGAKSSKLRSKSKRKKR
jgi:hypothetical protein